MDELVGFLNVEQSLRGGKKEHPGNSPTVVEFRHSFVRVRLWRMEKYPQPVQYYYLARDLYSVLLVVVYLY